MISTWTWQSGSWLPGGLIDVASRGVRYGMSVFETIGVFEGKVMFWEAHVERLVRASQAAAFGVQALPEGPPALAPEAEGCLRLYVFSDELERVFAVWEDMPVCPPLLVQQGVSLGISRRAFQPLLDGWKTGNYWLNAREREDAIKSGLDDVLLFNPEGLLVSSSMANVFLRMGGEWLTPCRSLGARDGVVRAWVMDGLDAREVALQRDELGRAREMFLTNSRLGVAPVRQIAGKPMQERAGADALAVRFAREILARPI